jgi:hypothetical protein
MTSQIYQADDGQLVQEHDQVVPDSNLMEQEADLAVAEPDHFEPGADPLAPDSNLAQPDADQTGHEDHTPHPAGAMTPADDDPATSIPSDYPGFTADADGAQEPEMADGRPVNSSLVSVAFTVPGPVTESHLAGNTASADGPWNEIQAMFVDDPRASIERAASLVNDQAEALIQSVRERQRSMQSAWQGDDAGTEELRLALRHYRTFWMACLTVADRINPERESQ